MRNAIIDSKKAKIAKVYFKKKYYVIKIILNHGNYSHKFK